MTRLVNRIIILFLLIISISYRVVADDFILPDYDYLLPDLFEMESFQWKYKDPRAADKRYEKSNKYNKHLLQGAVLNYLESKLTTLGIPHTAVALTGAAVIFAAGQDAKLNLNKSKTMSLQFKDLRQADRVILYRLKYSW